MAVFLMAVIVLGYVVIWAIWHFFFRGADEHVTGERPARAMGDGEASTRSMAGNDAPADGSEVSRVARHSASSGLDKRQA